LFDGLKIVTAVTVARAGVTTPSAIARNAPVVAVTRWRRRIKPTMAITATLNARPGSGTPVSTSSQYRRSFSSDRPFASTAPFTAASTSAT
jgi:hypothetical protein